VAVGVDGSAGSRAALAYALAAAAERGVGLDVIAGYTVELAYVGGAPLAVPDVTAIRNGIQAGTEDLVAEVRAEVAAGGVPGVAEVDVRIVVAAGSVAQLLIDHAHGAEMLVVGSRGRGAVRSALLGSVSLHCVTRARCPVVVVHPGATASPDPRVVVGVDGSPGGRAALEAAVSEAARTGATVDAVVSYAIEEYWTDLGTVVVPPVDVILERLRAQIDEVVTAVLADRAAAGLPVPAVTTAVVEGPAADVLVDRSRTARLLVVGGRAHGTLRGLLLGSVALACAMHASSPVMVVHPRARAAPPTSDQEAAPAQG
jgi:nucleotide-binding universal stress UspA family protein